MRISACMIVKNEEENLERCLNSIKDIVDEIVIVDTGSTDRTIEIAKRYTDKVYFHEWENNFSKHRNQSISYATGDWLLIIDADEELITDVDYDDIRKLLGKVPENINACAVVMEDFQKGKIVMKCNTARLFRNGCVYYKGRVHNQPIVSGKSAVIKDIVLRHYGYDLTPKKMQEKFNRTKSLLLEQYEKKENPHTEFYLCQIFGQHKFLKESQEWGEKYYKKREELGDAFNTTIYFTLTKSYIDTEDYKRAWEIISDFLKTNRADPDMGLAISDFGVKVNNMEIISLGCRRYLKDIVKIQETPVEMGNKFFFSLRDDVRILMLCRLLICSFHEAMHIFNILKQEKDKIDPQMKDDVISNLHKLGLSSLVSDLESNDDYCLPKLSVCL